MSTATTTSSLTTTAVPHALTTPFVPPPNCTDNFYTTIYTVQSSVITLLASGPLDSRFASCQPSGWDAGSTSLQFSPAVCPSGWAAYDVGFTTTTVSRFEDKHTTTFSVSTFTTAYCCSSGFSLDYIPQFDVQGISPEACFQNRGRPTDHYGPSTGMRVHNPWHISWATTDLASLSPSPPTVPCATDPSVVIPSWTPGATVDPGLSANCNQGQVQEHTSESATRQFEFFVIGMPILGLLLIFLAAGCWCGSHKRDRRGTDETAQRTLAPQSVANADRDGTVDQEEGLSRDAGLGQPKET